MSPVALRWDLKVPGPLSRAWALLGDSDRLNRVAGLPEEGSLAAAERGLVELRWELELSPGAWRLREASRSRIPEGATRAAPERVLAREA